MKFHSLIQWMNQSCISKHIYHYDDATIDSYFRNDNVWMDQLARWTNDVDRLLHASLDRVIERKRNWDLDSNGLGIPCAVLSEMLHHNSFAQSKWIEFAGRSEEIASLRDILNTSPDISAVDSNPFDAVVILKFAAVSAYICGASGVGKSSLMAFAAAALCGGDKYSDRQIVIRFCGTSGQSMRGSDVIRNICQQLAFNACRRIQTMGPVVYDRQILEVGDRVILNATFDKCDNPNEPENGLFEGQVAIIRTKLYGRSVFVKRDVNGEVENYEARSVQPTRVIQSQSFAFDGFAPDEEVLIGDGTVKQRGVVVQDWVFLYDIKLVTGPMNGKQFRCTRWALFSVEAALRKPFRRSVNLSMDSSLPLPLGTNVTLADGYTERDAGYFSYLRPGEVGRVVSCNPSKHYSLQKIAIDDAVLLVDIHPHPLMIFDNVDNVMGNWICDGFDQTTGCEKQSAGVAHETAGWIRYSCRMCNFDLCAPCATVKYKSIDQSRIPSILKKREIDQNTLDCFYDPALPEKNAENVFTRYFDHPILSPFSSSLQSSLHLNKRSYS